MSTFFWAIVGVIAIFTIFIMAIAFSGEVIRFIRAIEAGLTL